MGEYGLQRYSIELLDKCGCVVWEHVIDCRDDDEAILRTGRLAHPHPMRLRRGARVLASFVAGHADAPCHGAGVRSLVAR